MDDDYASFNHALFMEPRDAFEAAFEKFLTSIATPIENRRDVAIETIQRLGAIAIRLRAQGVL